MKCILATLLALVLGFNAWSDEGEGKKAKNDKAEKVEKHQGCKKGEGGKHVCKRERQRKHGGEKKEAAEEVDDDDNGEDEDDKQADDKKQGCKEKAKGHQHGRRVGHDKAKGKGHQKGKGKGHKGCGGCKTE